MKYNDHLHELDRLAEDIYGEFGFMTCSDEEMVHILETYLLSTPINEDGDVLGDMLQDDIFSSPDEIVSEEENIKKLFHDLLNHIFITLKQKQT